MAARSSGLVPGVGVPPAKNERLCSCLWKTGKSIPTRSPTRLARDTFPPKSVKPSILERFPVDGFSIPARFRPVTLANLASPSLGTARKEKARYE